MIDHFYDKLLHIGVINSGNPYLKYLADERIQIMKNWLYEINLIRKIEGDEACKCAIETWAKSIIPKHYNPKENSPIKKLLKKLKE
jgi:hypothetical protein